MAQVEVSAQAKFQKKDLQAMREFADDCERFDDTFLQSLERQFDERGYLTDPQYVALQKVMEAWDVEGC